jgi:hypothetical protein
MITKKQVHEQLQSIIDRVSDEKKLSISDLYIRVEGGGYCLAERMSGGGYLERSKWFGSAKEMSEFLYGFEKGLFWQF